MPSFQFPTHPGRARFRWHPDSRAVAVTSDGGSTTYILEPKSLTPLATVQFPDLATPVSALDWDEDGDEFYVCGSDVLQTLDFASLSVSRLDLAPFLGSAVAGNAAAVVVGTTKGALVVVNRETRRKQVFLGRHTKRVLYVRIFEDAVFSIADDRSVSVTQITGEPVDQVLMKNDLAFVRTCKHFTAFIAGSGVYIVDLTKGLQSLKEVLNSASSGPIVGLEFMNQTTVLVTYSQGTVNVVNTTNNTLTQSYNHKFTKIDSVVFNANICLFLLGDHNVTLWHTAQPLDALTIEKIPVSKDPKTLSLSPDGQLALVSCASDFARVHSLVTVVPKVLARGGGLFARLTAGQEVAVWDDVLGENSGKPKTVQVPFEPTLLAVGPGGVVASDGVIQVVQGKLSFRLPGVEAVAVNDYGVFAVAQGRVFVVDSANSQPTVVTEGDMIAAAGRTMLAVKGKLVRIFLGTREVKQYRHDALITNVVVSNDGAKVALVDGSLNFFILDVCSYLASSCVSVVPGLNSQDSASAYMVKFSPNFPGEVIFSTVAANELAVVSTASIEFFRLADSVVRKVGEGGVPGNAEVAGFGDAVVAFSNKGCIQRETYYIDQNNENVVNAASPSNLSDEVLVGRLRAGTLTLSELTRVKRDPCAILTLLLEAEMNAVAIDFVAGQKNKHKLNKLAVDRLIHNKSYKAALSFVEPGSIEQATIFAELGMEKNVKEIISSFSNDGNESAKEQILRLAGVLERKKALTAAAELYVMVGKQEKAVKLFLKDGDFDAATRYVAKGGNPAIWGSFGRAKEARGLLKEAVTYYERAGDSESVVRALCALGDGQRALALAKSSSLGWEYLGDFFAKSEDSGAAVECLLRAGKEQTAFAVAAAKGKVGVYEKVVEELGYANVEVFKKIAAEYEKENALKAATTWAKAGEFTKGFSVALRAGATDVLINILGKAKASGSTEVDVLTPQLISHVSGELDGQPKHPKYAYAVYKALGHLEAAAKAVVMVAKQEAALGNYKDAHVLLVKEFASSAKISSDLWNLLTTLHSYLLIKRQADVDNHITAALLVARVVKNIEVFPKHAAQILTSGVIESVKAGMRWEAYEYACELVKPIYRGSVPEAIKPKIELMVRKQKPTNDIPRFEEPTSKCPFCHSSVKESSLNCSECLEILPFCIFTGLHINDAGFCVCASCSGLAREHQALGPCPLCGADAGWGEVLDREKVLKDFNSKVGKLSNYIQLRF